jgi:hypothetical protein
MRQVPKQACYECEEDTMAYNAFPRSAQERLPTPPPVGSLPARSEPISHTALRSSATVGVPRKGPVAGSDQAVAATSALLRFLILLVIISGLTCLYVWQANSISAIKGGTQIIMDEIQDLDRQNVSLMLEYSRWDAPDYIEAESRRSGMVTGQAPVRVPLPSSFQRGKAENGPTDPISQLATWLPGSLSVGSQPN